MTTEEGKSRIGSFPSYQQRCCSSKMGHCLLPLPAPLLHWIISSLPPQRQFANHNLLVIILDDELWQLRLPRQKIPASRILPCHREGFFFFSPGIKKKDHFKCRVFFFKHSFSASLSSVCYFTADGLSLETNSSGCDTDNFPPPQEKEKPGRAGGKLGCGAAQPQSGEQLCTSSHPILCTSHPEVCKLSSRKNKAKITD